MKNCVNISFFQWNCRSIKANVHFLNQYLVKNSHKILLLQSLNTEFKFLPNLDGYFYPPVCSRTDGVAKVYTAIYIREDTEYHWIPTPVPKEIEHVHSVAVKVKLDSVSSINFLSIYYPMGPSDQNTDWIKHLTDSEKWVIAGDFNSHSSLWEKDCKVATNNRFVENIIDSPLYLLNDGSITRVPDVSQHKPTAIDLTLISASLALDCKWETLDDTLGSDHIPIVVTFNKESCSNIERTSDTVPKFNYKMANWKRFKEILMIEDTSCLKNDDIDIFYSNVQNKILQAAKISIPLCKQQMSGKHAGNAWWTHDCEIAVQAKKVAFKTYVKNKTKENHVNMKKTKINCNRVIALAKQQHWKQFCDSEISEAKDTGKLWNKIREMKHGYRLPSYPIKLTNNDFPSNQVKAEEFASIFAKSMSADGLTEEDKNYRMLAESQEEYCDPPTDNSHFLNSSLQLQEVVDAITCLPTKKTAVGIDAISNEMLRNLPLSWLSVIHVIFQKCWETGNLPQIWKKAIIIPILKEGKTRTEPSSYRPIALTSHVGKLMERLILRRLTYFCEKNNIVPNNQSGFRKGRSTIDHLIRLTTNIKRQFAHRKSVLATFFDVSKAYDQVWHSRLLYKLKTIGLSGNIYNYIKSFLSERILQTRVGFTYSSEKPLSMGIPQGSIIAPLLFTILVKDLPNCISRNSHIVQYADDIAMWMNTNLKRKIAQRKIKYIQNIYQKDLDNISAFMKENGLCLSSEKTNMLLFNSGFSTTTLPSFTINDKKISYKDSVKFLGLYLTPKLQWKLHIDSILTKARKNLNLLKVISRQNWCQDTKVLIHLATSLVRSKLIYAHEVFFSAPKCHLKKLQSIDSRAIKIALGIPTHASIKNTYLESGIMSLDELREFTAAKYIIRCNAHDSNMKEVLNVRSDLDFPNYSKTTKSLTTIATYTSNIFKDTDINPENITKIPSCSPYPPWEIKQATFDIEYTSMIKSDNQLLLVEEVKEHMTNHYPNHFKVFTDGSVTENGDSGAGFVIPFFNLVKSYYLGKGMSVFTCELIAILMALIYVVDLPITILQLLICVDSKAVLYSLKSVDNAVRPELIIEIKHLIHQLIFKGTAVDFCWVPSHVGIRSNERADLAAKKGAHQDLSESIKLDFSHKEAYTILKGYFSVKIKNQQFLVLPLLKKYPVFQQRKISSLICRLRLNAWKTKYCKNVVCICSMPISLNHVIFQCPAMKQFLKTPLLDMTIEPFTIDHMLTELLSNKCYTYSLLDFIDDLINSPLGLVF